MKGTALRDTVSEQVSVYDEQMQVYDVGVESEVATVCTRREPIVCLFPYEGCFPLAT